MSTPPLHPDIREIMLTPKQIRARVQELGQEISRRHAGHSLHVVGVLRGAAIFMADLLRELAVPTTMDFIAISSYGNQTRSSGIVRIVKDLEDTVEGRHVLVVEDVVDTGLTLNYLRELLGDRGVASLEVCALLDKPSARKVQAAADYVGFTIPESFVVGYGLDFRQNYRSLPYIATLRPEIYEMREE